MTEHAIEELDRRGLRNFAITFGGVVVALFGLLLPWLLGADLPRRDRYDEAAATLDARLPVYVLFTKADLLPYVDFDVDKCQEAARSVNPKLTFSRLSATTGDGLDRWYAWLNHRRKGSS